MTRGKYDHLIYSFQSLCKIKVGLESGVFSFTRFFLLQPCVGQCPPLMWGNLTLSWTCSHNVQGTTEGATLLRNLNNSGHSLLLAQLTSWCCCSGKFVCWRWYVEPQWLRFTLMGMTSCTWDKRLKWGNFSTWVCSLDCIVHWFVFLMWMDFIILQVLRTLWAEIMALRNCHIITASPTLVLLPSLQLPHLHRWGKAI